jgi:hypothetical protein
MGLFGWGKKDEPQEGDTVFIKNPEYGEDGDDREIVKGKVFVAPGDEYPELGNLYDINYETTDPQVEGVTFLERDEFVTEKEVSKPWWVLW